jgi:hypothetical protein
VQPQTSGALSTAAALVKNFLNNTLGYDGTPQSGSVTGFDEPAPADPPVASPPLPAASGVSSDLSQIAPAQGGVEADPKTEIVARHRAERRQLHQQIMTAWNAQIAAPQADGGASTQRLKQQIHQAWSSMMNRQYYEQVALIAELQSVATQQAS